MSTFLSRLKANYLEKIHGYPSFSLWISIALSKIYFYRVVLTWRKNLYHLVGTVLKRDKLHHFAATMCQKGDGSKEK